jgi:GTPase SAR1 family protein
LSLPINNDNYPSSEPISTVKHESSTAMDRADLFGQGFASFQSQAELAGQIFMIDPEIRESVFHMFNEFNIIVWGAPRVGKSTLINAICGKELAATSPGLDSCTQAITRYILQDNCCVDGERLTYTYNFWDAPGFEAWNETDIRVNVSEIVKKPNSDPLCMIYCAAPGSFADTKQIKWLLDVCINELKIFCTLVVTNKWAGEKEKRMAVFNSCKNLLSNYHEETSVEHGVTYFGNVGLCTMINARPYVDDEQGLNHEQSGVDELIEGIMMCLDDDGKVFHWCMTVMQRKGLLGNLKGKANEGVTNIKEFLINRFEKKKI